MSDIETERRAQLAEIKVIAAKRRAYMKPARDRHRREQGKVYYVQRSSDGAIKIGTTTNLLQRGVALGRLAWRNGWGSLDLLAIEPGYEPTEAERHRQFMATRLDGEWFAPTDALLTHCRHHPPESDRYSDLWLLRNTGCRGWQR